MKAGSFIVFLIFLSSSLKAQWIQTNGPGGGHVSELLTLENTLFAATSGGVYSSFDSGDSWIKRSDGMHPEVDVLSLVADGMNLFAGTYFDGIYFSGDQGNSWVSISNGLPLDARVNALIVIDSTILAGTYQGLYYSTNYGVSWNLTTSYPLNFKNVADFVNSESNIYAAVGYSVYVSSDKGLSWRPADKGIINYLSIGTLEARDSFLFAGSSDGALMYSLKDSMWTRIGFTGKAVTLAIDSINLFTYTEDGFFISSDNGISWEPRTNGMAYTLVSTLYINHANIYAGTYGGVLLSKDNGISWEEKNQGLPVKSNVSSLLVDGTNLFAASQFYGIIKSVDGGNSWHGVNAGITTVSNTNLIKSGSNLFSTGYPVGVVVSSNHGDSWLPMNDGLPIDPDLGTYNVNVLAVNGSTLYAGTNYGVYEFSQDDNTWSPLNNGLPAVNGQINIRSFAVGGNDMYVGLSYKGIYKSTDNGMSWKSANTGLPYLTNAFSISANNARVFTATIDGLYYSDDSGQSWTLVGANVGSVPIAIIGNDLYVGGLNASRSTDYGNSWTVVDEGLPIYDWVNCFAEGGSNLFVGTSGHGVYLNGGILNSSKEIKQEAGFLSLYPNPISNGEVLVIESNYAQLNQIEIFSLEGKLIYSATGQENCSKGIKTNSISPGIYLVKASDGMRRFTQKLLCY